MRGGRQAHPPNVAKVTWKRLNKKENRLALCSAIAGTAIAEAIQSRGHRTGHIERFPIIVQDSIEGIGTTRVLISLLKSLGIYDDVVRLEPRSGRSGRSALRGRPKKTGKSVLFVVSDGTILSRACGAIPGVECRRAADLSVLDIAPGSEPARLTIYSESALGVLSGMTSTHLRIMETIR